MFVYATGPIDDWAGWQKPEDVFRVSALMQRRPGFRDPAEWLRTWVLAREGARKLGWEGDCHQGPFVSVLPNPGNMDSELIIGWKQSNNGVTFIASRFELPWVRAEGKAVQVSDITSRHTMV